MKKSNVTKMLSRCGNTEFGHGLEALEGRQLLTAFSWDGGGDGVTWNDGNNWLAAGGFNNTVPGASSAADTASIVAGGSINYTGGFQIASLALTNRDINITGGTFQAGSATGDAASEITNLSGTMTGTSIAGPGLTHGGGTFTGTISVFNSKLTFAAGGTSAATFLLFGGAPTLAGNVSAGQTVLIRNSPGQNALVSAAASFTNNGTITLDAVNASNTSRLAVAGTLTNGATGVLNFLTGASGGGAREFGGILINDGSVVVGLSASLITGGSTITNNGSFTVDAGQTFTVATSVQTFTQAGGTITVNGTLHIEGQTFAFTGGSIAGTVLLTGSALSIATNGAGTFQLRGTGTIAGNVRAAQTILIRNQPGFNALITAATGFTNSGVITLDAVNASNTSRLAITTGTLTNNGAGTINFNAGSSGGGARELNGNLINNGTVNVNLTAANTTANATVTNNGTFNIAAGQAFNMQAGGQVFNQNTGATMAAASGGLFHMISGTYNFNAGTVSGSAYAQNSLVTFGNAGSGTIIQRGNSGTVSGTIGTAQALLLRNDPGFNADTVAVGGLVNNGNITLDAASAGNRSRLASAGTVTNSATGTITLNAGPSGGGARELNTSLVNNGTVNVNLTGANLLAGATFTNNGVFNIAAGQAFNMHASGQVFNQNTGASLALTGIFHLIGGTFNFNDGAVIVTAYAENSLVTFGNAGSGTIIQRGNSGTVSGTIGTTQGLLLRNDPGFNADTVAVGGLVNNGNITLDAASAGNRSRLASAGTVTNSATGTITLNAGPSGGGARELNTSLMNNGIVNVNLTGSNTLASATFTNNGVINIASGQAFNMHGGGQVFNQNTGATLAAAGLFHMIGGTFNFNAGTVTGTALAQDSLVTFGNAGSGTIIQRGNSGSVSGTVGLNQNLVIRNDPTTSALVTAATGFINRGHITLEALNAGNTSRLASAFTITNGPTGTITLNAGSSGGGARELNTSLVNNGTVNVNLTGANTLGSAVVTNNGVFNIAAGQTFSMVAGSQVFNQSGGSTLAAPGVFFMVGGTFNFNGGTVTGTVLAQNSLVTFGNAGSGSIIERGNSGSVSGTIGLNQGLIIRNDPTANALVTAAAGFTSNGTITLDAANAGNTSRLASATTITNGPTGVITINAGSSGGGPRELNARLDNQGTVNVNFPATLSQAAAAHLNSGTIRLIGANLAVTGASLTNSGTLDLRAGRILAITGAFIQTATGLIDSDVAGPTLAQYGRITATGAATLDGQANIEFVNGYISDCGDEYQIITSASATGDIGVTTPSDGTHKFIGVLVPNGFKIVASSMADWNNDGTLDSQDFFDFLEAFFDGDADFNGFDGTDSQDFFDFLEFFFNGCA